MSVVSGLGNASKSSSKLEIRLYTFGDCPWAEILKKSLLIEFAHFSLAGRKFTNGVPGLPGWDSDIANAGAAESDISQCAGEKGHGLSSSTPFICIGISKRQRPVKEPPQLEPG